jgi:hypothetical protein
MGLLIAGNPFGYDNRPLSELTGEEKRYSNLDEGSV